MTEMPLCPPGTASSPNNGCQLPQAVTQWVLRPSSHSPSPAESARKLNIQIDTLLTWQLNIEPFCIFEEIGAEICASFWP